MQNGLACRGDMRIIKRALRFLIVDRKRFRRQSFPLHLRPFFHILRGADEQLHFQKVVLGYLIHEGGELLFRFRVYNVQKTRQDGHA